MRFVVPQFIEVEDKIVGPLTFKQASYLIGAGGVALMLITSFGFFWAVVLGSPIYALAGALAFLKINNRPFSLTLFAILMYTFRKKLYLWKKEEKKQEDALLPAQQESSAKNNLEAILQNNTKSRLKELAWSLDTQQNESQNTEWE